MVEKNSIKSAINVKFCEEKFRFGPPKFIKFINYRKKRFSINLIRFSSFKVQNPKKKSNYSINNSLLIKQ